MPAWTIRAATRQDIDAVLLLWQLSCVPMTVGTHRDGLRTLLERDRNALLIAEAEGAVVGSLIAAWDGWRGSFYRLAVHPKVRRRGLGMALVREGERRLRERHAERLTAIVVDDDRQATEFWAAAGYQRQPDRARFIRSASTIGDGP